MNSLVLENVNDILSFLTIITIVGILMYFSLRYIYKQIQQLYEKKIQRLMKEDDWHM